MLNFFINLKKILPLAKNSLLPALIMSIALVTFYANETLSEACMMIMHYLIYILSFIGVGTLIYFNQAKPLMFIILTIASYICINILKSTFGIDYINSAYFINLCFFIPINLVFFYLLPHRKLLNKENVYTLIVVLIELSIFENISSNGYKIGYNILFANNIVNELGLLMFIIGTTIILFIASSNGRILQSFMLFSFIEITFGFLYSDNPTALTIFFLSSILTTVFGLSYNIYYSTFTDVLTSLASRTSYIIQSKKFPLKYSIAIICIDDYLPLSKAFKNSELDALTVMVANKISELEKENIIYRYDKDEFIIVFKNEGKNEVFDKIENIRRAIASSEFVIGFKKKLVKLTISASVADKKRSDGDSIEVLVRAKKALEKTNKFSQNVTTKA